MAGLVQRWGRQQSQALRVRPGFAGPCESVIQTLGTVSGAVRREGAHGGTLEGSSPCSEAKRAMKPAHGHIALRLVR
jgi:hypothetical protein